MSEAADTQSNPKQPTAVPRSLKERQREERKELILQAAEAMLVARGYHETSIDEIAAQVGIAKGTVYLHFPSKEDLVVALVERELLTFLQTADQAVDQATSARSQLGEHFAHDLSRQPRHTHAFFPLALQQPRCAEQAV